MFKIGETLKVPVLLVNENGADKGYVYGAVLGESKTVSDATELLVELKEGRFSKINIKNIDLTELNS